jgi:glycosyltransferase involved in cell wall biosynthesis
MVGGTDVLLLTEDWRRRRCVLKVLQEADAVVTTSHNLREKLLGFGLPPEKVHVNYRGLDSTLFFPGGKQEARSRLGIPVEGRLLLWVGRMIPVKGLDLLLEACSRLRVRDTEFHLYLLGDGPLRNALAMESRCRGLSDMVTFVGSVPHGELPDWYRAADLMVLPSRSEGVPNVLRESLACGTPFVASRVGGIPEIGHDPANRLILPDDPQALADAIAQGLMTTPAANLKLQSRGWGESAESLLRLLRLLLKNQGRLPASMKSNLLAVS